MSVLNFLECKVYKAAVFADTSMIESLELSCSQSAMNIGDGFYMISVTNSHDQSFIDQAQLLGADFEYEFTKNTAKMSLLDLAQIQSILNEHGVLI